MVVYKRASERHELEGILEIQKRNRPDVISTREMLGEGFVTVSHTFDILERMNNTCPHIIAKDVDKVVGYALCMHPKFSCEIEVLKPMFHQISLTLSKKNSFMVMGQICIDRDYRKKGVFRALYETMKNGLQYEFDCIITEVDTKNSRSLNAHYAVGFEDLKEYSTGKQEWKLIILK